MKHVHALAVVALKTAEGGQRPAGFKRQSDAGFAREDVSLIKLVREQRSSRLAAVLLKAKQIPSSMGVPSQLGRWRTWRGIGAGIVTRQEQALWTSRSSRGNGSTRPDSGRSRSTGRAPAQREALEWACWFE
jgi:hypothetical protein